MAAPIAHIFLAVQLLAGPCKGLFNEKEFIVGTSFPDIRYLKVVERTETHFTNVTLQDILKEKDSFKAGMMFHSFVDEQREAYVVKNHLYDKIPAFRFTSQSLKFAEDELLKPRFHSIQYSGYFDDILDAEKAYGIDEQHIRVWHTLLQGYLKSEYSGHNFMMKYFDLNQPNAWLIKRWIFSWLYARKVQKTISFITHDTYLPDLLLDFYRHFVEKIATQGLSQTQEL